MIFYTVIIVSAVAFFTAAGGVEKTSNVVQTNVDGSTAFNKSAWSFVLGFFDENGNMWKGNTWLFVVGINHSCSMTFNLQSDHNGYWYQANYALFFMELMENKYEVHVTGFSGNASHDAFDYQDSMLFTTYDSDNDYDQNKNCASDQGGGFWYNACCQACVNSARSTGNFKWVGLPGGQNLRSTNMVITCIEHF